tara:strand:+ start:202 stop:759 length:558 start_codon:yes stop_codon:yes gene_type:complete
MQDKKILLQHVTKEDVKRINTWLSDESVAESWFGRYSYGNPAHLGYHPEKVDSLSVEEWDAIFENPEHRIFSIYTEDDNSHIGEIHITIEESLGDAQISILIGDTTHWHQGYGTATLKATLDIAFNSYGLFRVWADIPDYNVAATHLFENLGFVHEGTLRKSRPHDGVRHDSVIMGMLSTEFLNS